MLESPEGEITVYAVNDLREQVSARLRLQLFDFHGKVLYEGDETVVLEPDSSVQIKTVSRESLLRSSDPQQVVLLISLERDHDLLASNIFYFAGFRDIELPQPRITIREVPGTNGTSFTLESDSLARQVWLSAQEEGIFSDNFFDLIPGVPMTVRFYQRSNQERPFVEGAPGDVTVRSMVDFVK